MSVDSAIYILLPVCVDVEYDVFFNVLKNIVNRVGRAKLADNHYLLNAFKCGMVAQDFDFDTVSSDWKISNKKEVIQQMKLLGFWTLTNCSTFGRIFYGDNWNAPTGDVINVTSTTGTKIMTATEINDIISPKMKCIVMELTVSESTQYNLRYFVKVPRHVIDTDKGQSISVKMKSYEVRSEYLENCWVALKEGKWLVNTDAGTEININKKPTSSKSISSKRTRMDSESEYEVNAGNGPENYPCGGGVPLNLSMKPSCGNAVHSTADAPVNLNVNAEELQDRVQALETRLRLEIQQSIAALETQLNLKKTSFAEIEQSIGLPLQLNENEVQQSMVGLESELREKNTSLANFRKDNEALHLQLTNLEKANQTTHLELIQNNNALAEIKQLNVELQTKLNEAVTALADVKLSNAALELDSNKTKALLADSKKAIQAVQLELAQTNEALTKENQLTIDLESELKQQKSLLTELELAHQSLQNQLSQKTQALRKLEILKTENGSTICELEADLKTKNLSISELEKANQALQLDLKEKTQAVASIQQSICGLEFELKSKNTLLAEFEKKALQKNEQLEAELNTKNSSICELGKSNQALQLDLKEKTQALRKLEILKTEIASAINELEAELKTKNSSISELEKANQALQLDLKEKTEAVASIQQSICGLELELQSKNALLAGFEKKAVQINEQISQPEQVFQTDDPIVKACRKNLLQQKFGWIQFQKFKKCVPVPGFVFKKDEDGEIRAQKLDAEGYVCNVRNEFYKYFPDVPEQLKSAADKLKLKKFNDLWGTDFI